MAENRLRAVVATSTLDLGIDWGDVDLVVHVGAPKGASRLAQRIGRANHRMDEPSKAILVPANRFEVMECRAALDANYIGAQDTPPIAEGALDVLAQHVLGMACAEPFDADELYREVTSASPYADLPRTTFDRVVDFTATGGYALRTYERYARIRQMKDGRWRVSNPAVAQQYRLNLGTIVEAAELNVRMVKRNAKGTVGRGGMSLGKVEEYFLEQPGAGRYVPFAGKVLRFEGIRENECLVSQAFSMDPKIPSYAGGKFPLSTYLADQVRSMLSDPARWQTLPDQVRDWLAIQKEKSIIPRRDEPAGGNLPLPKALLHGHVSLRGTLGAPDARHASDAPAGACGRKTHGLRRHRLFAGHLGDGGYRHAAEIPPPVTGRPAGRGHARRRSGSMAGRILHAEAHLPQLRRHFRADRTPSSRQGKDRPSGHGVCRSYL